MLLLRETSESCQRLSFREAHQKTSLCLIAWMINGCDDEAGIGQRLCSVMMHGEPPAPTVGEDNQRQLLPSHGTVFHAR